MPEAPLTDGQDLPDGATGDLDTRVQIHNLVVRFYREIVFDDLLGPVFSEVAEVDWATHIPKLIDYWCRVLLGHPGYNGYILTAHQDVHEEEPFVDELFDRWYALFVASIDGGWSGPVAERAKAHAAHMAGVLSHRLTGRSWQTPNPRIAGSCGGGVGSDSDEHESSAQPLEV